MEIKDMAETMVVTKEEGDTKGAKKTITRIEGEGIEGITTMEISSTTMIRSRTTRNLMARNLPSLIKIKWQTLDKEAKCS
jgi:hypothetical protein